MEYTVEDISPVKKKVQIKVGPDEVEAAIKGATALYKQSAQLDGFRKGKAPAQVIEKRFHDHIYKEAKENLINVHINDTLQKTGFQPVSGITIHGDEAGLKKGEPYDYTLEFEILPVFDLPNYEGLEVDEEKARVDEKLVDHMLEKIRREKSKLIPVEGTGPAKDGQIANIDFETFVDGKPIDDFRTNGFDLEISEKAALPEFVDFVKTIPVGHTAEKVIHFPKDFVAERLADKDANMRVTVHAVKERQLPELDEKFAEAMGQKDMAGVRQNLAEAYAQGMRNLQKAATQRKLLDKLVSQTEYELPPSMLDMNVNLLVGDIVGRAEREGRNIINGQEDIDKLKEQVRPEAESRTREKVLLLAIAKKENLEVKNEEVEREIFRSALKMGHDVQDYYDKMRQTGMIFQLRDSMLTDKAMDLVYERAKVNLVEPEQKSEEPAQDQKGPEETAKSEPEAK